MPAREAADAAEAALARLAARQLESLPRGGDEAARWSLELPVRLADGRLAGLHLRIEDERGRDARDGEGRRWQVRLALELPDGASVHAAVGLAGRQVGVRLLTPDAVLARALAEGLPHLAEALRRRGLEPGVLDSRAGRPAADEDPARLQAPGLVDLEA
ncbi:MAG TPA: flagellar hook-length control protein FliK [Chromatiales bacterium]|nr:flagellar hook-length control protein FliK [Chromatiales bacterium]